MSENPKFDEQVTSSIERIGLDEDFQVLTNQWTQAAVLHKYTLNYSWLGRPIVQSPSDIYAFQELIWKVRPDLIIETGIAHGGSMIMSASMLAMLDYCDAVASKSPLIPGKSKRKVVGIDIDIRQHNRRAIEQHPMTNMIKMFEGSSVDPEIVNEVQKLAKNYENILVFLDSNHIHDHVLKELRAYAPMVSLGSYCVVWDTEIEDLPDELYNDRPWGKGDNPKTAVLEYLKELEAKDHQAFDGRGLNFETDKQLEHKLIITAGRDGFLRRM